MSFADMPSDDEINERAKKVGGMPVTTKAQGQKSKDSCPKCMSSDINYTVENVRRKRNGIIRVAGVGAKIATAPASFGLSLFAPTGKKTVTEKLAVCQNCGHVWSLGKV